MQQQVQEAQGIMPAGDIVNGNPQFTVDSRLMENYLLESPISSAGSIVSIRDGNNLLNVFTIGNTGKVYCISPDAASDTGWKQTDIGVTAKSVAVGILASNLMIVYGYSDNNGGTLFSVQQTAVDTWGTMVSMPGVFPGASIATRNFHDGLYFAFATVNGAGVVITPGNGSPGPVIPISLPAQPPAVAPICLAWSFLNNVPCLVIATHSMLYSWAVNAGGAVATAANEEELLPAQPLALFPKIPNQQVLSLAAIEDYSGNAYLFAILNNNQLYYLKPAENYWQFYQPVLENVKVGSFVVSLNISGELQVLAVNKAGNLFHTTGNANADPGQWTLPWQIRQGVGMVASAADTEGSSQAFILSSDGLGLSSISQDLQSTDWNEDHIAIQTATTATKIASFTMEVTLLDSNGRPNPYCGLSIMADNNCVLTINGTAASLNAGQPFECQANGLGKLFLCLQTDTLSAPQFGINTSWMKRGQYFPVQPNIQVQDKLKALNAKDLLNAPDLLTGLYHTQAVADSLVSGIQQSLNLAQPDNAALLYSKDYHASQYQPSHNSYYTSSRINLQQQSDVSWQMDFSSGVPVYKDLSAEEARALIVMKKGSLPVYPPHLIGVKEVSWGDFWQSIKEGIASIIDVLVSAGQAIVTIVVNGIQYFFESVISLVQQVFDLIQMFFDKVQATFEKLYNFLKFILNWDDILLTQQVISNAALQLFDTASAVLGYAKVQSNTFFDSLIAQWSASFTALEQRPVGTNSFLQLPLQCQY